MTSSLIYWTHDQGLERLARALMGELTYRKLKRELESAEKCEAKAAGIAGLHEIDEEILKIVNRLGPQDLRLLVIAVMAGIPAGIHRLDRREASAN